MIRTTIALFVLLFSLSACETVKGVGQDMQSAGVAVENEAQDAQTGG